MDLRPELLPPVAPERLTELASEIERITALLTRAEPAEIVRRIQAADPETDYYSRVVDASVSDPDWAALVFHTPALDDPDQIAGEILTHRPIAL
ncbi:hypothetical protein G3I70_32205 [Actinomadura bangladeshensis]|uniref:Uncharacterized protein n=2 Tax=Actinomadura bangladeshensis TaxID=453573 RepID=A0A6L9QPV7_9ACTN|nr:hypothetical protein [Actinomadura bangladeshensis]